MRLAPCAAVVLAALSLAASVDAQTLTVENLTFHSGDLVLGGHTGNWYARVCTGESSYPATCSNACVGPNTSDRALYGRSNSRRDAYDPAWSWGGDGTETQARSSYVTATAYSDSSCQTTLDTENFRVPPPGFRFVARTPDPPYDDTPDTLWFDFSPPPGYSFYYTYKRIVGGGGLSGCRFGNYSSPVDAPGFASNLDPGTEYTFHAYSGPGCDPRMQFGSVTFTTDSAGGFGGSPSEPSERTPDPPTELEASPTGSGAVTVIWENPGNPNISFYEYLLEQARQQRGGEWRRIAGSNADTTSVTIDLTTGEARAGAARGATPPMTEWIISLRARDVNGNTGARARTTVTAAAETVPALPVAWALGLALLLALSGGKRFRRMTR